MSGTLPYRPTGAAELIPPNDDFRVVNTPAVGTVAVDLIAAAGSILNLRRGAIVQNLAGVTMYVGPNSSVTASGPLRGLRVQVGEKFNVSFGQNLGLWAITAAGLADGQVGELA